MEFDNFQFTICGDNEYNTSCNNRTDDMASTCISDNGHMNFCGDGQLDDVMSQIVFDNDMVVNSILHVNNCVVMITYCMLILMKHLTGAPTLLLSIQFLQVLQSHARKLAIRFLSYLTMPFVILTTRP